MEIKKINIASCEILKDNGSFKTYKILDTEGNRYGSTEEFEIGEQEVQVTVSGQYTNIKKIKTASEKKFPVKDYTFEKKKVALEQAVCFLATKPDSKSEHILLLADKLFEFLK